MRNRTRERSVGLAFLGAVAGLSAALVTQSGAQVASNAVPAWTDAQLEEDWLMQARMSPENLAVLARRDAAGVNDGLKSGSADHQTRAEQWAWWQVDLGASVALDRIEVFNPSGNFGREAWFKVLLSADGRDFTEIYCLEGPTWPRDRRLEVKTGGKSARWVRVSAGGRDSLRLSEVEVYGAADPTNNIALRKPSDQSSYATRKPPKAGKTMPIKADDPLAWQGCLEGTKGPTTRTTETEQNYPLAYVPVAETIARGQSLAAALEKRGVNATEARTALADVGRRLAALPEPRSTTQTVPLYLESRRAIRRLAFANPLVNNIDRMLFVKRVPGSASHSSSQFNSEYVRPGGGICLLEGLHSGHPTIRTLTADFPAGNFTGLELSHDASRILFAFARHYPEISAMKCPVDKQARPEESFYHLYEMELATGRSRQITHGRYDDFHGSYLPNGEIVFVSTRRSSFLQVGMASAQSTLTKDYPDIYLRCGVSQIYTLHRMAADGSALRTLSPTDTHEWYPITDRDGRLLYARWDYVDRDARIAFGLWSCNPDGTRASIVYGNYTREPYCVFEARPVPNSHRLVFTGSAHHANTGGPLLLLDPNVAREGPRALTNLTPEVCMPESQGFPLTYYQAPWPLSEEFYLCGWSERPLIISTFRSPSPPNDLGLYLYDAFGNRELIHRDPAINSSTPVVVAARPTPPRCSDLPVCSDSVPTGKFLLNNVYAGLDGIAPGTVKRLRIVAVPPKVAFPWGNPSVGFLSYEPGKFVLGTVPVEADGSAHFVAPAGVSLWFQALAEDGRAVQTMRTVTYLQGGEIASCTGCHERRYDAPVIDRRAAFVRAPSKIRPDVEGSWPLRFDRLVQPTLERLLAVKDPKVADLDLVPARVWKDPKAIKPGTGQGPAHTWMWKALISYGGEKSLFSQGWRQDVGTGFAPSIPGDCLSRVAAPWELLTSPVGAPLTADEKARLALWMDTYGQIQGHFSTEQEAEIAALRERWAPLLEGVK